MESFISVKELAKELRIDRSTLRRFILNQGMKLQKRRTKDSRSQKALVLTQEQADMVRALRRSYATEPKGDRNPPESGVLYVIQLIPEVQPNRVKLGFAEKISVRLRQHRTAAPTAKVLKTWPCRRSWEPCAIAAVTTHQDKKLSPEVFIVRDLKSLLERGEKLFSLLNDAADSPKNDQGENGAALGAPSLGAAGHGRHGLNRAGRFRVWPAPAGQTWHDWS